MDKPTIKEIKRTIKTLETAEVRCPKCDKWIKENVFVVHYITDHTGKP